MNKLLFLPILILTFFALAGCSNNVDYTYVEAFANKEMYNDWIKNVEFSDKFIVENEENMPDKKATRFEIYLPKNIVESTRYVTTDIEEIYNDRYESVVATAYSFSNLSQVNAMVLNTVNLKKKDIRDAYNKTTSLNDKEYAGLDLPESYSVFWSMTFGKADLTAHTAKEGYNRAVATAYIPVKIDYFTAKDKSDAVKTLTTHVILPVTTTLTYTKNGALDTDSKFLKFSSVELKVDENGFLK